MSNIHEARRESFSLVKETCPSIDNAARDAKEAILAALDRIVSTAKEDGTEKLREALTDKCHDAALLQDRVDELEAELDRRKTHLCDECLSATGARQ